MWRVATLVMIPKAEAFKWRLIAMLVTPYRVWARMAGEDVSRWMAALNKPWIANGPKQSAEQAVYDIALNTEADNGEYGKINMVIMDDLEKGFEKVIHDDLVKKAKVYQFPENPLTMALSMYKAARRIRCGKAFSKPVITDIGVLAGCPIAMGLLLLASLDPIERFWSKLPQHMKESIALFKVYVDDYIILLSFDSNKLDRNQIVTRAKGIYTRLAHEIKQAGGNFAVGKGRIACTDHTIASDTVKSLNVCECRAESSSDSKCNCSTTCTFHSHEV